MCASDLVKEELCLFPRQKMHGVCLNDLVVVKGQGRWGGDKVSSLVCSILRLDYECIAPEFEVKDTAVHSDLFLEKSAIIGDKLDINIVQKGCNLYLIYKLNPHAIKPSSNHITRPCPGMIPMGCVSPFCVAFHLPSSW